MLPNKSFSLVAGVGGLWVYQNTKNTKMGWVYQNTKRKKKLTLGDAKFITFLPANPNLEKFYFVNFSATNEFRLKVLHIFH